MILFGFGSYFSILSHSVRFHIECNTHFGLFGFETNYDEATNGFSITIEILKTQIFLSILSNCQDLWFNIADTSMLRAITEDEVVSVTEVD